MNVSALEEYGLRCAVRLASVSSPLTLSAAEIAESEGLSVEYVSKFMLYLRRGGLVRTVRGAKGGFSLSRPADQITLKAVFDALGNKRKFSDEFCKAYAGKTEVCVHTDNCTIRPFWSMMQVYIEQFTTHMTLADLVQPAAHTEARTREIARRFTELHT
jgi:Rrf2 family transcriptional regulator, iron-sulfur cluster assembly transcription factor